MATPNQIIGKLLKELRIEQGVRGVELGRKAGMSQSKISKLETGLYPRLHFKEIERILNILNAPRITRQRIYSALGSLQPEDLKYQSYNVAYTKDCYQRELKTIQIRTFSPFVVPALLQTNEYRIALLKGWGTVEDEMDIIKANAQRQDLLWDKQRQFHFIMHQAALYTGPAGQKGLGLPQIDRIERFMGLPNIKIGIIPLEAGMPPVEFGPFALLDERMLITATVDGDLHSTNSKSIELYSRIFSDLNRAAVYGVEANHLIRLALDFFDA